MHAQHQFNVRTGPQELDSEDARLTDYIAETSTGGLMTSMLTVVFRALHSEQSYLRIQVIKLINY